MRGYCRRCDAARSMRGAWPGQCETCATPAEPHPVPDLVQPALRCLFIGINPGVATARSRAHFGNPRNPFWLLLHEAGLTPRLLSPHEGRQLLQWGLGVTNVVTRATPGSADVTREDIQRGRARLAPLVEDLQPRHIAFVGKQAAGWATGRAGLPWGPVDGGAFGRRAFVLPSTSPANAAVSLQQKRASFEALARELNAPR
jgi:double-stranded uracil-DNA glycosylase